MAVRARIDAKEREHDLVAARDLDTRYAKLRLASPEEEAALSRSIARHGVLQPLTVNRDGERLVVLDGFKRLRALGDGSDVRVPVRVVVLTAPQATAALVTFNRPHRGLTDIEEAWVVQALVRDHNLPQTEVAALLGHHKSWVCRRLQLVQRIEEGVVEDVRLGLISPTVARELVRLPRGNQASVAMVVQQHGLTSRQTVELVNRLEDAHDEGSKRELLADPLRFLESQPSRSVGRQDARLSGPGDRVLRNLDALARQARIASRVIHSPTTGLLVCSDVEVLRPRVRDVVGTLQEILTTLTRFLSKEEHDDA